LHMASMDSYVEPSDSLDVGNFDDVMFISNDKTTGVDEMSEQMRGANSTHLAGLKTASIDSNEERGTGGYHPGLKEHFWPDHKLADLKTASIDSNEERGTGGYHPGLHRFADLKTEHKFADLKSVSIDSNEERGTGGYHPLFAPAMNTAQSVWPMVSFMCMQMPVAKRPRWSGPPPPQQPEVIDLCSDEDDDMEIAPNENDEPLATPPASPIPSSGGGPPPPSPTSAAGTTTTTSEEANEGEEDWERRREKRVQAIQRIKETDLYRAVQAKLRESGASVASAWVDHAHEAPLLSQTNRDKASAIRAAAGGQPALRRPRTPDPEDRSMTKRPWESAVLQWRSSLHQLNATPPRDRQQASDSTWLPPAGRSRRPRRGGW